jgi:hypothetical protein
MFSILHQHNFDKFEFLKIRNLSDHFMTFGISHFSTTSVITGPDTTRTYYAMFYAKIHAGIYTIIVNELIQVVSWYVMYCRSNIYTVAPPNKGHFGTMYCLL